MDSKLPYPGGEDQGCVGQPNDFDMYRVLLDWQKFNEGRWNRNFGVMLTSNSILLGSMAAALALVVRDRLDTGFLSLLLLFATGGMIISSTGFCMIYRIYLQSDLLWTLIRELEEKMKAEGRLQQTPFVLSHRFFFKPDGAKPACLGLRGIEFYGIVSFLFLLMYFGFAVFAYFRSL